LLKILKSYSRRRKRYLQGTMDQSSWSTCTMFTISVTDSNYS
jgi:hypothetical protein